MSTKFKDKQRITIFIEEEKASDLKRKATKLGVSLSDLISISASEYNEEFLKKQIEEARLEKARNI